MTSSFTESAPRSDAISSTETSTVHDTTPLNEAEALTPQEPHPVGPVRFALIFVALNLSIFLFSLDSLIVATSIPKITEQFHSLTQISWLGNGFFVTLVAFGLAFSQWLAIFPSKHVCLFAIAIFELGSLLCGVAPSMVALIIGRSIAGLGGTGIFTSAMMIITEASFLITTMQQRAKLFGFMGLNFLVSSVTGPIIGGAFADNVTWRWSFYINLPIGGLAFFLIALLVPKLPPYGRAASYEGYGRHMLVQLLHCDWLGVAIVLSWCIVSVLVMQQGGVEKSWSSASIIAMFVMIPVLGALFVFWELYLGEKAMMPIKLLFTRRLVVTNCIVALCTQGAYTAIIQYLSEGYQAVYNTSATKAGIFLLPFILANLVVLVGAGQVVARTGRPWIMIIAGPAIMCIGSGLLYSVKATGSKARPMGYSAVLGVGSGLVSQNVFLLAQYAFHKEPKHVALSTGTVGFASMLGRVYVLGISSAVFENMIPVNMHKYAPSLSADLVAQVQSEALAVWTVVPDHLRPAVLNGYEKTLNAVYITSLPFTIIGVFAAVAMGNLKMDMSSGAPGSALATKNKEDIEMSSTTNDTGKGELAHEK